MMRSPRSFAVVCRRPSGEIVIKEAAWQPLWAGLRFLRWPFLRGSVMLVESMINGLAALSFAARQQTVTAPSEPAARSLGARAADPEDEGMSKAATYGMLAVSIAFGLALFVGVPHLLAWLLGTLLGFDSSSFMFHLVDGIIKLPLMLPVAGLAYELLKLSGARYEKNAWARAIAARGLWLQKITTREPDDGQLEIALISIRKTLWRERQGATAAATVEIFPSAADVPLPVS